MEQTDHPLWIQVPPKKILHPLKLHPKCILLAADSWIHRDISSYKKSISSFKTIPLGFFFSGCFFFPPPIQSYSIDRQFPPPWCGGWRGDHGKIGKKVEFVMQKDTQSKWVANSNMFFIFTPKVWGLMMQFDFCIFFPKKKTIHHHHQLLPRRDWDFANYLPLQQLFASSHVMPVTLVVRRIWWILLFSWRMKYYPPYKRVSMEVIVTIVSKLGCYCVSLNSAHPYHRA